MTKVLFDLSHGYRIEIFNYPEKPPQFVIRDGYGIIQKATICKEVNITHYSSTYHSIKTQIFSYKDIMNLLDEKPPLPGMYNYVDEYKIFGKSFALLTLIKVFVNNDGERMYFGDNPKFYILT